MIKCNNGKYIIETIVNNGGVELRGYEALSRFSKMQMLVETCRKVIIYLLLNMGTSSKWIEANDEKSIELATQMFGYFSDGIVLKSKRKADNVLAVISLVNDESKNEIVLNYNVSANEFLTEGKYLKSLERDLQKIKGILSDKKLAPDLFIKGFFDALNSKELCFVKGSNAVFMRRMLDKIPKYFPDFKQVSYKEKISILRNAYNIAMRCPRGMRDKFTFARATFAELYAKKLVNNLKKTHSVTGRIKEFRKIGVSANTIETQNESLPCFIDYAYNSGDTILRTSFSSFELWELLTRGSEANLI